MMYIMLFYIFVKDISRIDKSFEKLLENITLSFIYYYLYDKIGNRVKDNVN